MLLQIVAFTLNVGHEGFSGCQLDTGDLSLGRVGLLGFSNNKPGDDALPLGTVLKERGPDTFRLFRLPLGSHRLVDSAHGGRCWVEEALLLELLEGGR